MINLILNIFNNNKTKNNKKTFKTYTKSWKSLFLERLCDSMPGWIVCFEDKFKHFIFGDWNWKKIRVNLKTLAQCVSFLRISLAVLYIASAVNYRFRFYY